MSDSPELAAWKAKHGISDAPETNKYELRMLAEGKLSDENSWCSYCDKLMPVKDMRIITRAIDPYRQCNEGPTDYICKQNRVRACPECFTEHYESKSRMPQIMVVESCISMLTAWCRTGEVFALADLESGHWDSSIYARRSLPNEHFLGRATFAMIEQLSRYQIYERYLETDHWKGLRHAKFNQVGKACQCCGNKQQLHCHHIRYRNLTDCTVHDLAVLCYACHNTFHTACKALRKKPDHYDSAGSIGALIKWYKGTDRGIVRESILEARQRDRVVIKRQRKDWKRQVSKVFDACRKNSYRREAVARCIEDLTVLLEGRRTDSIEHLLLNYSATESLQPGTALEVLKTVSAG